MDVEIVKVLVLVGLFLISILTGFVPLKLFSHLRDRRKGISVTYHRMISVMSCFAAGIFLASCLMDLLPETREDLEETFKDSENFSEYPVAEFIMVIGLMLMLTIEQTVLVFEDSRTLPADSKTLTKNEKKSYMAEEKTPLLSSKENNIIPNGTVVPNVETFNMNKNTSIENKSNSVFKSFVLLIALSLHSAFEGLAVGLQKESSDVLEIFIGLVVHKAALAFSLGMTLTQSKMSYWASLRSLFTFSIASPIGIAIGLLILEYGSGSSSSIAVGILQGLACGTFLYVTFFEILQRELNNKDIRLVKVVSVTVGFILMSALYLV